MKKEAERKPEWLLSKKSFKKLLKRRDELQEMNTHNVYYMVAQKHVDNLFRIWKISAKISLEQENISILPAVNKTDCSRTSTYSSCSPARQHNAGHRTTISRIFARSTAMGGQSQRLFGEMRIHYKFTRYVNRHNY